MQNTHNRTIAEKERLNMSKTDERLKKSADEGRENRAMTDRVITENREVSENERVEMFRQNLFQSSLPDLPDLPGWHMCWLTTTNSRDSIQMRIRLGYEPVKPEDVPGWEYASLKTVIGKASSGLMKCWLLSCLFLYTRSL
jgi:hypothetical protein